MRVRLSNIVMGAVAAGILAVSFAAPNALASSASQTARAAHLVPPPVGSLVIGLYNNNGRNATSEGTGAQMQIHSSGYSTFNLTNGSTTFVNQSGNCVRSSSSGVVSIGSGVCGSSNTAARWDSVTIDGHSGAGLKNEAYGCIMYAAGNGEGAKMVCVAADTPGDYLMTSRPS